MTLDLSDFEEWLNHCRDPFDEKYKSLFKKTAAEFKIKFGDPIGCGKCRLVFANDRNVFKIPIDWYGVSENEWEARRFRNGFYLPMARCRISTVNKLPICVMERLSEHDIPRNARPEWVDFVDGCQVGLNRKGELVAFDYGN